MLVDVRGNTVSDRGSTPLTSTNPIMDSFTIDLPFTRESWHGRIKACRGVLASMDTKTFERFEEAHIKILQQLPEQFTIKHKVFLTYYIITK